MILKGVNNLKILHICLGCFYVDNYSYQENMLPKYHKLLGFDVSIIASLLSFDENGQSCLLPQESSYLNEYEIPVTRVDYLGRFKKITKFFRIFNNTYKLINKEKPDLIFVHGCQFWDIRKVIKYKKKYPNVKIYADNHSDYVNSARNFFSKNILHKVIWKSGISKFVPICEKIYGVTPNRCDFLVEVYGVPEDKVQLLVMGADNERFALNNRYRIREEIRKEILDDDDEFILITGGKIDNKKNIHNLMTAIKDMDNKKIKLIVFGTVCDDMKQIIDSFKDVSSIINIGWINSDEIYKYFIASDLAVFPGTHSVLWEQAVGMGIPCIFKKWDGMTHVDVGGNCEFIYEGNAEEIKKAINRILDNRLMYNNIKEIAKTKGIEHFSYYEIAKKSIDLI